MGDASLGSYTSLRGDPGFLFPAAPFKVRIHHHKDVSYISMGIERNTKQTSLPAFPLWPDQIIKPEKREEKEGGPLSYYLHLPKDFQPKKTSFKEDLS